MRILYDILLYLMLGCFVGAGVIWWGLPLGVEGGAVVALLWPLFVALFLFAALGVFVRWLGGLV